MSDSRPTIWEILTVAIVILFVSQLVIGCVIVKVKDAQGTVTVNVQDPDVVHTETITEGIPLQ